jgi:CubicO group peptidase (beta-lactamase class C family)
VGTERRFGMQRVQKKAKAELAEARKVGLDPDRLSRLREAVEEDTARGLYDGAVFLVARHGKVVMHEAVGHTDLAKKRKANHEDVFFIMSLTKQMTAVRVLMDIERGKFIS